MGVPDRIYRITRGYLDAARGRLEDVEQAAVDELDRALEPGGTVSMSNMDDPMQRAAAKIAAARRQATDYTGRPLAGQRYNFSVPEPGAEAGQLDSDPIQSAYRVIGVPIGSDFQVVSAAVARLRERSAPERYPVGSAEREEAVRIQERVNQAFGVLQDAFGIQGSRFDRLEL
ncbi:MAG: hypothetical protein ACLQVD_16080 [Capsulimonadaceae bacterium]